MKFMKEKHVKNFILASEKGRIFSYFLKNFDSLKKILKNALRKICYDKRYNKKKARCMHELSEEK